MHVVYLVSLYACNIVTFKLAHKTDKLHVYKLQYVVIVNWSQLAVE